MNINLFNFNIFPNPVPRILLVRTGQSGDVLAEISLNIATEKMPSYVSPTWTFLTKDFATESLFI